MQPNEETAANELIEQEISKLDAAKKKPLSELLGSLQSIAAKHEAEPALLDLGIKIGGTAAYCRRISLSQKQSLDVSCLTGDGKVDYHKAAAQKSLLISLALTDKKGAPIYKNVDAVDIDSELGELVWMVCARVNRVGAFRNADPETGEAAAGNSPPSKS